MEVVAVMARGVARTGRGILDGGCATYGLDLLLQLVVLLGGLLGLAAGLFGIELSPGVLALDSGMRSARLHGPTLAARPAKWDEQEAWRGGRKPGGATLTLAWNSVCMSRASCRFDMVTRVSRVGKSS